jgi:hypothetical protein
MIIFSSSLARIAILSALLAGVTGQAGEDRVHQQGKIRVFYQTVGEHAVERDDRNQNGIPDQVENVLSQTVAAQLLFVETLGFPDPFQQERFRAASFLDIHIRHKNKLKSNGLAFDELQRFNKLGDPTGTVSIAFSVASSVKAESNLTPAHEFFHLIQYSTTYFKNNWFAEGTARWSEAGLGVDNLGPVREFVAWPLPKEQSSALFKMSYEASEHFWNPLAAKSDSKGLIPDSPALKLLQSMRYTDGTAVLKDLRFTGWAFIRAVVIELGKIDDLAFRESGYTEWSEANQFSSKNNSTILRAVEAVVSHQ